MEEYYLTFSHENEDLLSLHLYHVKHYSREEMFDIVKDALRQTFERFGKDLDYIQLSMSLKNKLNKDYGFQMYQQVNIYEYDSIKD